MNKVDVFIISIPGFDSPIIRDFIHRYHNKFNKIYYVFNYVKGKELTDCEAGYVNFITDDLKDKCEIIHQQHECFDNDDWRSLSIKNVLGKSNADYIFSIEPDFVGDWDKIIDIMINKDYDIFTNYTSGRTDSGFLSVRLWPSFWGCKKSLLNQIDINFSSMPDPNVKSMYKINYNKRLTFDENNKLAVVESTNTVYDHFDYVSTQLVEKSCDDGKQILLLNRFENIWYKHIAGITNDFYSIDYSKKLFRRPNDYSYFYKLCRECKVNLYQDWINRSDKIINYEFV